MSNNYLVHHGILGQKWGVRRFQNRDGSYTSAGLERYGRLPKKKNGSITDSDRKEVVKAVKALKKYNKGNNIKNLRNTFKNNSRLDRAYTDYKRARQQLYDKWQTAQKSILSVDDQVYEDFDRMPLKQKKRYYKPFFDAANERLGIPKSLKEVESLSDLEVDNICYNVLGFTPLKNSRQTLSEYVSDQYNLDPWDDVMEDIWSGAFLRGKRPTDLYYADNKEKYKKLDDLVAEASQEMQKISGLMLDLDKEFTQEILGDLADTPITQAYSNGDSIKKTISQALLTNLYY